MVVAFDKLKENKDINDQLFIPFHRASLLKNKKRKIVYAFLYMIDNYIEKLKKDHIIYLDKEDEDTKQLNIMFTGLLHVCDFIDDKIWEQMYNDQKEEIKRNSNKNLGKILKIHNDNTFLYDYVTNYIVKRNIKIARNFGGKKTMDYFYKP